MRSVRWNIHVAPGVNKTTRDFLAAYGKNKRGDLSRFIEEAVCARIIQLTPGKAKANEAQLRADICRWALERKAAGLRLVGRE